MRGQYKASVVSREEACKINNLEFKKFMEKYSGLYEEVEIVNQNWTKKSKN
jgi:hypothetical protein